MVFWEVSREWNLMWLIFLWKNALFWKKKWKRIILTNIEDYENISREKNERKNLETKVFKSSIECISFSSFFNAWYYNSFFDKFAKIIIIANQFESWYKVCSSRYICQKSTSKWSTSTSSTSYIIIIHISQKSGKLRGK